MFVQTSMHLFNIYTSIHLYVKKNVSPPLRSFFSYIVKMSKNLDIKKSKKKKRKRKLEDDVTNAEKCDTSKDTKKKKGHMIEDLFSNRKKRKQRKEEKKKKKKDEKKKKETEQTSKIVKQGGAHRYDAKSGLPVYTMEALGIGQGGGTSLCPFDCTCCF